MLITPLSNGLRKTVACGIGACILSLSSTAHAEDKMPTREEMWQIIQKQQNQIDSLLNQQAKTEEKVEETAEKVSEVKELAKISPASGHGGPGWFNNTQLGGYGEMHYNGGETDEIDFHRFVLFVGHDFNEDIRFFSELELEHAFSADTSDGSNNGAVELEQAFIEFDLDEQANHQARAGLFLVPTGILNETHEPTTFFGVERNNVEKNIIPTTWWEGGAAYAAKFDNGFSTDVAVHSGLSVDSTYKIRTGRQKVSTATAKDPAITGRVKWTGMPGVEVGVSGQWQRDIRQSQDADSASATLIEAHTDIRKGPYGLRALAARWDIDGSGADALGRDVQQGWFVEPAYYFDTPIGEAGVFARYQQHDNTAGNSTDTEIDEYHGGINFWPHEDVVLKADYQIIDAAPGGNDDNIVNLGVGYMF